MKLIDLLVKELPQLGGWPDGAVECCRHYGTNSIDFYDETGNWDDDCYLKYGKDFAKNCIYEESSGSHRLQSISRSEYESALAASEGWIEWHGGECPVDSDAIVEIKNRRPIPFHFNNDRAGDFDWAHTGSDSDIIAYRLQHPGFKSRANDDRLEQDLNECIGQDIDIPEWNGEGLPPVGTICQAKVPRSITGWEWRSVKVVESGIPGAEKEVLVYDLETTLPAWTDEFRPLRTEAEMAREKLAASLHIAAGASPIELNGIGRLYFKLADAIISGSVFGTTFKAGK